VLAGLGGLERYRSSMKKGSTKGEDPFRISIQANWRLYLSATGVGSADTKGNMRKIEVVLGGGQIKLASKITNYRATTEDGCGSRIATL